MSHDPQVQSLEQTTLVPSTAWEAFFDACMEWAEVARDRRAMREAKTQDLTDANEAKCVVNERTAVAR